ncbi:hypothetical protein [Streptomyces colonosanans]|uniref:hypothetical protein n=1 Tax=Streptomyces colonosanans TaxID=1428652 RepID=UPI001C431F8F|nr:hypothetical protein [Streptomyces colonosanans]
MAPWRIAHIPSGAWMAEAVSRTVGRGRYRVAIGQARPFRIDPGAVVRPDIVPDVLLSG